MIILRAIKPIAKGEEITIQYTVDYVEDHRLYKANILRTWRFECDCRLCLAESSVSADVSATRRRLEQEALTFIEEHELAGLKPSLPLIKQAENLSREIAHTYDKGLATSGASAYFILDLECVLSEKLHIFSLAPRSLTS